MVRLSGNLMKIYTKSGDAGKTGLMSGERVWKDAPVVQVLGDLDETNALIGSAVHCVVPAGAGIRALREQLEQVQSWLLDVGAVVAAPPGSDRQRYFDVAGGSAAKQLESWIDEMDALLPALTNFILPGGGPAAATLHVARAVARRCERSLAPFVRGEQLPGALLVFINRLSDYLFVAARRVAQLDGHPETVYRAQQRVVRQADEPAAAAAAAAAPPPS